MATKKTVHFWVYGYCCDDLPVCIMLDERFTEDEPFTLYHEHKPTDEGWREDVETYWLDGDYVHCCHFCDGVDCDGRSSETRESRCHVDNLADGIPLCVGFDDNGERIEHEDLCLPKWERVSASQRDYEAERAGY